MLTRDSSSLQLILILILEPCSRHRGANNTPPVIYGKFPSPSPTQARNLATEFWKANFKNNLHACVSVYLDAPRRHRRLLKLLVLKTSCYLVSYFACISFKKNIVNLTYECDGNVTDEEQNNSDTREAQLAVKNYPRGYVTEKVQKIYRAIQNSTALFQEKQSHLHK